jgi:hypothetical protein
MDWNVIGADLITRLTPIIVVALVYWIKGFLPQLSPIATNILAAVLTAAITAVDALISGGTWNPVQSAALTVLATLLAELIKNVGAKRFVKKMLLVKGS